MNLESKTALDIASTPEMKSILEVADAPTLAHKLKSSKTRIRGNMSTYLRIRANMTEEKRNTWLIVATLVATAIYQSGLSPPGGIYQVSAGDDNGVNISSNSTISTPRNVGKSVLSGYEFSLFLFVNMYSFTVSVIAIYFMIPRGIMGFLVASPMGWFTASYLFYMWRISPTQVNSVILVIVFASFLFVMVVHVIISVYVIAFKPINAQINLIDDS